MKPIDMINAKAEAELLELIQRQDAKNFSLPISCADGRWTVAMEDLDGNAGVLIGDGDCFPAAWFGVVPGWAR